MRVRGDNAPSNAFTLEEQPKKPGFFLVRFYENAQEFSETRDGLTITGSMTNIIWSWRTPAVFRRMFLRTLILCSPRQKRLKRRLSKGIWSRALLRWKKHLPARMTCRQYGIGWPQRITRG